MSDYEAKVKVRITGMGDLDKLEQQLQNIKSVPIKLDVKSSGIKELLTDLKAVQTAAKSIGNIKIGTSGGGGNSFNTSPLTNEFKNLQSMYKSFNNTKIKIASLDATKDVAQITALEKRLSGLKKQFESAFSSVGVKNMSSSQISSLTKNLHDMEGALSLLKAKGQDTFNFKTTNFSSQLKELSRSAKELGSYDGAKKLQSQVENLKTSFSSLDKSDVNFDKKFSSAQKEANKLATTINKLGASFSSFDAQTESNKMLSWAKNNTAAGKETIATIKKLAIEMQNVNTVGEKNNILAQYKQLTTSAQAAGKTGLSGWDNFKRGSAQIGQFVGVYGMFQQGVQVARQMASAVIDVDSAMTELRKVSDAPSSQITSYFDQATASAKKYGAMISDVILSTSDWSRLGYNLKDSAILSDATTLLQKVGDNMTQESSSEGLISILKGFNKEADDVGNIIDVVNEVANKEPIDTAGIVSALQRSSSSLSAAGNDMNQSISMITAANSVVQDPESVGTAFKTMSMRIRGAKTDLESAGLETDGMAESTAKLQEEMLALSNVNIMKDKNTFKSTYDILDDLADKWEGFSDIQQASITELIAGRQTYLYVQKCA